MPSKPDLGHGGGPSGGLTTWSSPCPAEGGGKSIFAYDKLTGDVLWSNLDDKAGYVSPQVATLAGQRQLLIVSGTRVLGASLDDGSELWSHPWEDELRTPIAPSLL